MQAIQSNSKRMLIFKKISAFFSKSLVLSIPLVLCGGFLKMPSDDNWKCSKCGYENLKGINRCPICGTANSFFLE